MVVYFYDKLGKPLAYCDDTINIFSFSGKPLAYICGCMIYSYSGAHIGWFEFGWVRDLRGFCVFSTNLPLGYGPLRSYVQHLPVLYAKQSIPIRHAHRVPYLKPFYLNAWSHYEALEFFIP